MEKLRRRLAVAVLEVAKRVNQGAAVLNRLARRVAPTPAPTDSTPVHRKGAATD
jgi:hypothetical protein